MIFQFFFLFLFKKQHFPATYIVETLSGSASQKKEKKGNFLPKGEKHVFYIRY